MRKLKTPADAAGVKKIYTVLTIIGALFFANPVISSVDVLPDCIGCALLFFGLTRLAYLNEGVDRARRLTVYLFAVGVIKLLLTPSFIRTNVSANLMLASTAFLIAEGILYFLIIKSLFAGIEFFASLSGFDRVLKATQSVKTLTFAAFFIRLFATLIPDLTSIAETKIETVDEAEADILLDIVKAKPIITALMLTVAAVALIAWFIEAVKFILLIRREAGEEIERRYASTFLKIPEKVSLKKLKIFVYVSIFASVFALDISFDGIKVLPVCAMFLIFAVLPYIYGKEHFGRFIVFTLAAFVLLGALAVYEHFFVVKDPVVIYETPIRTIIVGTVLNLVAIPVSLYALRMYFCGVGNISRELGQGDARTTAAWVAYCLAAILRSLGSAVPYFRPSIAAAGVILAAIFIVLNAKALIEMLEAEKYRLSLEQK